MYNVCTVSKKSLVMYAEFPREEFGKTSRGKIHLFARSVEEIFFSYCIEQTILLFVIIACAYYFKDVFLGAASS